MQFHEIIAITVLFKTCSAKLEPFIVNGLNAKIEDFPFIAFVIYYDQNDGMAAVCGGSLLSSQSVLTAAHCLDDITNYKKKAFKKVSIFMGHSEWRKATMVREAVDYKTHEDYDIRRTRCDIGLLFLMSRVKFSNTVKKTVLQTKLFDYPRQKYLFVAGWGAWANPKNITTTLSEKLRYLSHEFIPVDICQELCNLTLDFGTICAGSSSDDKYVFGGDSGGPLVTTDGYQLGLVSYKSEENSHGITVFTHIPDYVDWIEETQAILYKKNCPDRISEKIRAMKGKNSKSFYINKLTQSNTDFLQSVQ